MVWRRYYNYCYSILFFSLFFVCVDKIEYMQCF